MPMTTSQASGILTMVSGAGSGVKGAYQEVFASTNFTAKWMWVGMCECFAVVNEQNVEWDFATGSASAEVDDYPDIFFHIEHGGATQDFCQWSWPINIPSGSRVAFRIKDEDASARTYHFVCVISDTLPPTGSPIAFEQLGPVTVTSPASAGSDGPIVELSPAIANKADWIWIMWMSSSSTSSIQQFDIMTGGGGSELDRLGEMGANRNIVPTRHANTLTYCGPISLDAGERISTRVKTNVGTAQTFRVSCLLMSYQD